jgi:hypothetical protein
MIGDRWRWAMTGMAAEGAQGPPSGPSGDGPHASQGGSVNSAPSSMICASASTKRCRMHEGSLSEGELNSHVCDLRRCSSTQVGRRIIAGQGQGFVSQGDCTNKPIPADVRVFLNDLGAAR